MENIKQVTKKWCLKNTGNEDLQFDYEGEHFSFTAKTKEKYMAITKEIDSIHYKRKNLFEIYAWYDVSGYDYWVMRQEEPNYIMITVVFLKENFTGSELKQFESCFDRALDSAHSITSECRELTETIGHWK